MIKFFKEKDCSVRKVSSTYHVSNYITKKISKKLSVVIGKAKNHVEITKNTNSDRAYYVLKGAVVVNYKKAKAGETIYIPKNTEYKLEGTFEALIINAPAFDPKWDSTKVVK